MGQLIFGKPITIEGRRFNDLKIQASKEGVPRPIVFGTVRPIVGNVIAAAPPRIVEVRQRQGGKGGGGATTVSEEVYRTYAIRICEGPDVSVVRVWRNGEIIYDRDSTDPTQIENNAVFLEIAEFFSGDFEQQPSAVLQGIFGVNEVPAYRGTCYMVIDDENLTNNGGAIPQYEFEVERCPYEILTSKPFPAYAVDGMGFSASVNKSLLSQQPIEGINFTASVVYSNLREPLVSYDNGKPEGINFTADVIYSSLREPLVEYSEGKPEGISFTADIVSSNLREVLVEYSEGEPEGLEFTADIVYSNLYT